MKKKIFTLSTPVLTSLFLVALMIFFCDHSYETQAQALSPVSSPQDQFTIVNYTNTSQAKDVTVDGDVLWVATTGGVLRWDTTSHTYTKFTTRDGLLSNHVNSVLIAPGGKIWFGTSYGANVYDGAAWTYYNAQNSPLSCNVNEIAMDSGGVFWFATSCGLVRYDGTTWTTYTKSNSGLVDNLITCIAIHGNQKWFGYYRYGVGMFDGAAWASYLIGDQSIFHNMVNDIAIDLDGSVWAGGGNVMGSSGGGGGVLAHYTGGSWISYTPATSGLIDDYVFAVDVDDAGVKWIGTELGLSKFDGSNWTSYTTADGLSDNWVWSIAAEANGIWIGTDRKGVSQFNHPQWVGFDITNQIIHNSILSIGVGRNEVWIGAGDFFIDNGGLTHFNGYRWDAYTVDNSDLPLNEVLAIAQDGGGNWWFGTRNGVVKYDGQAWTTYSGQDYLAYTDWVQAVATNNNDVWIGTSDGFCPSPYTDPPCGGLSHFDGTNWITYTAQIGIPDNIQDIALEGSAVWLPINNGMGKLEGTSWITYTIPNGLTNNSVNSIEVDGQGNKWLGTANGLSKFDGATWHTYKTTDGLLANNISDLAFDPLGNLWIASWKGLNMYDGVAFYSYTIDDGLVSKGVWRLAADEDGLIWIGTGDGIGVMQPVTKILATPGITTTIASTNQQVNITIPQNAISTQTYFTYTQQLGPTQDIGNFQFAGASFSLDAKDINGGAVTTFNAPLSMVVSFSEITLPDVTKLKLYYWDVVNKSWQDAVQTCTPASDYVYDINSKQLTVDVCHLTDFAVLFQPNPIIYLPLVLWR